MKKLVFILCVGLALASCKFSEKIVSDGSKETISTDSLSYEIVIMDVYFDQWYVRNFSPALDRDNSFYQMKNLVGVTNWNDYFRRARYPKLINSHLFYDPTIDYGLEVNRKLYWYFKYYEENFQIRMLH